MNPWTDEETEQLVRMVADGKSAREIAVLFGRSRNAVIGRCGRLGLRLAGGNARNDAKTKKRVDSWTEETWRRLAEMWNAGRSTAEIARAFGISESRVKQRAAERRDLCPARANGWNSRRASQCRSAAGRYASRHDVQLRDDARNHADSYDATALNVTMIDIRSGQCRWPVNAPERGGEFLFCGHEVAAGKSYCQHHHLRGTVPTGRVRA